VTGIEVNPKFLPVADKFCLTLTYPQQTVYKTFQKERRTGVDMSICIYLCI